MAIIKPRDGDSLDFTSPSDVSTRIFRNSVMFGDPFQKAEEQIVVGDGVTTWQTYRAMLSTGFIQQLVSYADRGGEDDASYNAFQHIKDSPHLNDDEEVRALVRLGQFDAVRSQFEFDQQLFAGRRIFDHFETLGEATWWQLGIGMAASIAFDPLTYVAGLGIAAKVAKAEKLAKMAATVQKLTKAKKAAQLAKGAGITGVVGFSYEKSINLLQPATNTEGLSNEIMAYAMGAGFYGIAQALVTGVKGAKGTVTRRRLAANNKKIDDMMEVRPLKAKPGETNDNGTLRSISEQIDDDAVRINKLLEEDLSEQIAARKAEDLEPPTAKKATRVFPRKTAKSVDDIIEELVDGVENGTVATKDIRKKHGKDITDEVRLELAKRKKMTPEQRAEFDAQRAAKKQAAEAVGPTEAALATPVAKPRDATHATVARSEVVLHREGDAAHTALVKLRAKYKEAGIELLEPKHSQQNDYDLIETTRAFWNGDLEQLQATAHELGGTVMDEAVTAISGTYAGLLSHFTPQGRMNLVTVGRLQSVIRTLSGSARTIPAGSATNPRGFMPHTAAENILGVFQGLLDVAVVDMRRIYREAKQSGQPITYNGKEISSWFGYQEFKDAVGDYGLRRQAESMGFEGRVPDDVHPSIKAAADAKQKYFLRMRDEAEGVDLLHIGPREQAIVRAEIEVLEKQLIDIETELRIAQDTTAELFNPDRTSMTNKAIHARLKDLKSFIEGGEGAGFTPIDHAEGILAAADADAPFGPHDNLLILPDDVEGMTPAQKAKIKRYFTVSDDAYGMREFIGDREYDAAVKFALEGDDRVTMAQLTSDIIRNQEKYDPQIVMDAFLWQKWREMSTTERRADRRLVNPADLPEHAVVDINGTLFEVQRQSVEEGRILVCGSTSLLSDIPNLTFGIHELDLIPVLADSIAGQDIKSIPANKTARPPIERIRARHTRMRNKLAARREGEKRLGEKVAQQETYQPIVFNDNVRTKPQAFVDAVVIAFRNADNKTHGIGPKRTLVPEAVNYSESMRKRIQKSLLQGDDDNFDPSLFREEQLDPQTNIAYQAELEAYYKESANDLQKTLTDLDESHGVVDAMDQSPLKSRVMNIDYSDISNFVVLDIEEMTQRYHRVMAGRIAVRRAIQLSPDTWAGTGVIDGPSMMKYLNDSVNGIERLAAMSDEQTGHTGRKSMMRTASAIRRRVENDIGLPLKLMEGRTPRNIDSIYPGWASWGRSWLNLSVSNKLGSVALAQANDLAPQTLYAIMTPQALKALYRALFHMRSLDMPSLKSVGLAWDGTARARAISDTEYTESSGKGVMNSIERLSRKTSDAVLHGGLMIFLNQTAKRSAGAMAIDANTRMSRRMLAAFRMIADGAEPQAAYRKAGIKQFDVAKLNAMGFNEASATLYHRMVWEHGLTLDDLRLKDVFDSFDSYMKTKETVKPNIEAWPIQRQDVNDMFTRIAAGINGEVNRSLVVTPGFFDRPNMNHNFGVLGKMFNQFQNFGLAFVNQRLTPMSQMPAKYQMWLYMNYMLFGAMSDAAAATISGRRTLEETAELWKDPKTRYKMFLIAFERSGLIGPLSRPIAFATGMGLGPDKGRPINPGKTWLYFSPVAGDVDKGVNIAISALNNDINETTAYNAAKLLPGQNLLWLRALSRFDLPVTPEMIPSVRRRFERLEPKP